MIYQRMFWKQRLDRKLEPTWTLNLPNVVTNIHEFWYIFRVFNWPTFTLLINIPLNRSLLGIPGDLPVDIVVDNLAGEFCKCSGYRILLLLLLHLRCGSSSGGLWWRQRHFAQEDVGALCLDLFSVGFVDDVLLQFIFWQNLITHWSFQRRRTSGTMRICSAGFVAAARQSHLWKVFAGQFRHAGETAHCGGQTFEPAVL